MRLMAPATDCARVPGTFLEDDRAYIGGLWLRQEYLGEFVNNATEVFDRDAVERALDDSVRPLANLTTWDP
jgi:hypothetical protein